MAFEGKVPQTLQVPEGYFDEDVADLHKCKAKLQKFIDRISDDMDYTTTVDHQTKLEQAFDKVTTSERMLGIRAYALLMSQLEEEND